LWKFHCPRNPPGFHLLAASVITQTALHRLLSIFPNYTANHE
jgi:hypothetical protein